MHLTILKSFANSGGDWVIYLLIAASVWSIAIILERFVIVLRQQRFTNAWETMIAEEWSKEGPAEALEQTRKKMAEGNNIVSRVVSDLIQNSKHIALTKQEQLEIRLSLEKRYLEKRLLVLGTLGNNAPFIGLLGTVLGVIRAFHDLASTAGGPEVVMQGLSEALIATAVGILVAIPCVAAYNLLQKRIKDILLDLDHIGKRVIALTEK